MDKKTNDPSTLRKKVDAPLIKKAIAKPRTKPQTKPQTKSHSRPNTTSRRGRPAPHTPPVPMQKKMRVVLRKKPTNGSGGSTGLRTERTGTGLRTERTGTGLRTERTGTGLRTERASTGLRSDYADRRSPFAPSRPSLPLSKSPSDRYQQRKRTTPNRQNNPRGRDGNRSDQREYNYREFARRRKQEERQGKKTSDGANPTSNVANPVPKSINIVEGVTVSELARKMNLKGSELVRKLLSMGTMAGLNEKLDSDAAALLAEEYECKVNFISLYDETELPQNTDQELTIAPRSPIVTVMGHVDHGKTTLLDTIRKANVTASESGGITQHIAAYQIEAKKGQSITFIDTPGHEAFTLMRARGAHLTDIVVLVVAADDSVMPQTKEAIDHAKEAKVPIIVAINKIDLAGANIEQTKKQLSDYGLVPEEWGGETIFCPISALKGDGVPDLLDAILVNAEELTLTAPANGRAEGKVLESRIDHGRGIVCTVLVQKGMLENGDNFLAGIYFGKVRAMFDDKAAAITSAGPSRPVEVLGFNDIPNAGDPFQVASSEKEARAIGRRRQELKKAKSAKAVQTIDIDNVYQSLEQQAQDAYKIILKGDVDGSIEAIKTGIERLKTDEIKVEVIRSAVGDINSTDVLLASASHAVVIGFHVRPSASIQRLADQEGVSIKRHTIIYRVLEELEESLAGLQKPTYEEVEIGVGEVRTIFAISKIGTIAGSFITKGKIKRDCVIELFRDSKQIHRGQISGLKRFKDDAKEVDAGYECGITLDNFNKIEEGDTFRILEEQRSN